MTTEVWVRNPQLCIRECLAVPHFNWAWDIGFLLKKNVDIQRFADTYAPSSKWRQLVIGNSEQGAIEVVPGKSLKNPKIVHPVWSYGENFSVLEKLISGNKFERVVVVSIPNTAHLVGKNFMRDLADLQADNPEVKVHPHGLYSYSKTFGLGFGATDVEIRQVAKVGAVFLPTGKRVVYEQLVDYPHWVSILNMKVSELSEPSKRCIYNLKSALWAGKHFNEIHRFQAKFDKNQIVDDQAVDDPPLPEAKEILLKKN